MFHITRSWIGLGMQRDKCKSRYKCSCPIITEMSVLSTQQDCYFSQLNTDKMVYLVPQFFQEHGVVRKLHTKSLLIAINLVAGLSIFFFGYDQGMLSYTAVNCTTRD